MFLAGRYAVTAAFKLQPAASRRQALEAHLISAGAGSAAGAAGQALELPACQPISASAVSAAGADGQTLEVPACQPAAADAHPDHGRRVLTTAAPQSSCQALITSSLGLQASEVTSLTCSQGMASEYGLTDQNAATAAASRAGIIAGTVIGVVVGLALIAAGVAAAFILHKRRQVCTGPMCCCIKNSVCTLMDD